MKSRKQVCTFSVRRLAGAALLGFLLTLPARGALILVETVSVNSLNPAAAPTSTLQSGVNYLFEATGTYYFAFYPNADVRQSDANYFFYDSNAPLMTPTVVGALHFDGAFLPWKGTTDGINFATGTYSPSHVYRHSFVGDGNAHSFRISDTFYSDNVGTLQVQIFKDTGDQASVPDSGSTLMQLGVASLGLVALLRRKRR